MALLLARRQRRFTSTTTSLVRLFSNSSPDPPPKIEKPPQSPSSFTDVKNSLKNKSAQSQNRGSRASLQDLSLNLARFQRRSAAPESVPPSVSFEALYNRRGQDSNLSKLREDSQSNVGSNEALPTSVYVEDETEEETMMMTEFLKIYKEDELGEKLKMLRPEGKKEGGWFSLEELNERLVKLRKVEEKEVKNQRGKFSVLRNVIGTLEDDKAKHDDVISLQSLLDGTPEYKHYPPKDELVETYFHSDNLSSAEKMKVELTKVKEYFKMSESDCGSARVQVAQLTTKIKHLTSALHKKDKHSKKGLVAMVQKRKKLLKYLRRTDWDSYCLVLSQHSLRDIPDYKIPNYKDKA
ncbi:unnamed protein product [Eruca vesicaria subsp. sativa]|uniref:Small ribosomal subunit protein uS15c n=1 Tax=Eruca vesicaria subsp. sativa TaxID=29727 RepID=A0ABC8LFH4_ERUVS|nr:unnamed protein product [Eruca vesicaria subsp. sativa]